MKIAFGILSALLGISSFIPYWKDIFLKKTTPHVYSWLIWSILQAIGVVSIVSGNGGLWGVLNIGIGALCCLSVFFLSFRYGTENIRFIDKLSLAGALAAICVLVFTRNPLYSIVLITLIDFIGFVPTMRKAFEEPFSETPLTYFFSVLANIFALLALSSYVPATVLYLASLVLTSSLCFSIIFFRRNSLKRRALSEAGIRKINQL